MDIYRVPADVVPRYLQGRPRTLIKHCLVRKTKSNKFTHDSIHQTDTRGSFEIFKDSGAKHTVSFFTESDEQMPSCTCKDWARWHIPCKHFLAIFCEIPDWTWESLPTRYLSSSYLITDNGALVDYFINQGVSQDDLSFFVDNNIQLSMPNASNGDVHENLGDSNLDQGTCHDNLHVNVPDEDLTCELPKRKKDITVQDSMLKARVTLQNLKTLSYNFPDQNVSLANEFTEKLDELYQSFYSQLPGLIILSQAQESIRSTKRREHINRNTEFANLPPRKKYKKSVDSRVGSKADRLRIEANKSKVSL